MSGIEITGYIPGNSRQKSKKKLEIMEKFAKIPFNEIYTD